MFENRVLEPLSSTRVMKSCQGLIYAKKGFSTTCHSTMKAASLATLNVIVTPSFGGLEAGFGQVQSFAKTFLLKIVTLKLLPVAWCGHVFRSRWKRNSSSMTQASNFNILSSSTTTNLLLQS